MNAMSSFPEDFEEHDDVRDRKSAERPPTLTPLQELTLADGYRWASLDVVDLDPPTWFPPQAVN
jgi:hypothetical protein